MKRSVALLTYIALILLCAMTATGQKPAAASGIAAPGLDRSTGTAAPSPTGIDSTLTASLITCYPGPEVYELCGHEALRIRGAGIDSVWNYGVFDFLEPNFVYRFVKGETDYMLAGYPFSWFLPDYQIRGSRVVEQDLNFTPEQTARLRRLLQVQSLPQHRKYRYNYVRDNCATRIVRDLQRVSGDSLDIPDDVRYDSFRQVMRKYHKDYPWYQFGIDIALGQGIDQKLQPGEQMFVPMEMMQDMAATKFKDGRPLIKATRVLNEGRENATLPPTPFWLTPLAWSLVVLLTSMGVAVHDVRRVRVSRWWWSVYYGLTGTAGCIVTFLVFFSSHDSTSPNLLILWLNPLQLLIAAGVWIRRWHPAVTVMSWANMLVVGLMLLVWPMQRQSGNAAIFPMMAADLVLAAVWAIISNKTSYNNVIAEATRGRSKTATKPAGTTSRKTPSTTRRRK